MNTAPKGIGFAVNEIDISRAEKRLRTAIEENLGAAVSVMAPAPISDAFRRYADLVCTNKIETDKLQTHMDDEVRRLDDEAKP